jgi:hypothetical protein
MLFNVFLTFKHPDHIGQVALSVRAENLLDLLANLDKKIPDVNMSTAIRVEEIDEKSLAYANAIKNPDGSNFEGLLIRKR